jgi:hypothetical protein
MRVVGKIRAHECAPQLHDQRPHHWSKMLLDGSDAENTWNESYNLENLLFPIRCLLIVDSMCSTEFTSPLQFLVGGGCDDNVRPRSDRELKPETRAEAKFKSYNDMEDGIRTLKHHQSPGRERYPLP